MSMDVIQGLAQRFPQLYLPPQAGTSESTLYRSIVRRGMPYSGSLSHFKGSARDSLTVEATPAGDVEVLFLEDRRDFECFYRIMSARCEPVPVPPTMGSCCISGFNDWSRIHHHMSVYISAGGKDAEKEFARFTADPANYKGTLLLLSEGPYSALSPERTPYSADEWTRVSLLIRKYHEITHFVCRRLFPLKRQAIWDELLADCMGLLFAAGSYDIPLACAFLGIEDGRYTGGRLENYTDALPDSRTVQAVLDAMEAIGSQCVPPPADSEALYRLMLCLEEDAEKLCAFFTP